MSTHNIGFYEDLTKIIFELSSNTHLISSAEFIILLYELKLFLIKTSEASQNFFVYVIEKLLSI